MLTDWIQQENTSFTRQRLTIGIYNSKRWMLCFVHPMEEAIDKEVQHHYNDEESHGNFLRYNSKQGVDKRITGVITADAWCKQPIGMKVRLRSSTIVVRTWCRLHAAGPEQVTVHSCIRDAVDASDFCNL